MKFFYHVQHYKRLASSVWAGMLIVGMFSLAAPAQAALTPSQVNAVVLLLTSFGADQITVARVWTSLVGAQGAVATSKPFTPLANSLSFSASEQPDARSISGANDNVPFTAFTLTNNTTAPATIQSVVVHQNIRGSDANFSSIALVGGGIQLGASQPLVNHQADVGEPFTIAPGQSIALTVVGNTVKRTKTNKAQLQVVAINSSTPINGSLPISGAIHSIKRSR